MCGEVNADIEHRAGDYVAYKSDEWAKRVCPLTEFGMTCLSAMAEVTLELMASGERWSGLGLQGWEGAR